MEFHVPGRPELHAEFLFQDVRHGPDGLWITCARFVNGDPTQGIETIVLHLAPHEIAESVQSLHPGLL